MVRMLEKGKKGRKRRRRRRRREEEDITMILRLYCRK